MHKLVVPSLTLVVLGLTAGISGCSSGSSNSTGSAAQKSAFCGANIAINKASADTTSESGFLAVLKAHKADITTMKDNLPGGSVGADASAIVDAAEQAISQNSTDPLSSVSSSAGGDIDTYCGVDGTGNPLPSYFAAGNSSTFCSTFAPIESATADASSLNAVLQALISNKSQVAQLATEVSGLPSSIQSQASSLVSEAQSAISSNSTAPIQNSQNDATDVALYCGYNS